LDYARLYAVSYSLFNNDILRAGTPLDYGLDDQDSRVRFLAGAGNFSLHYRVQNGSGAHPASYPMGNWDLSLEIKWPGREADHSPPSSAEVKECVKLYLHSSNMPPWRGAEFKKKRKDNFAFTLTFNNDILSTYVSIEKEYHWKWQTENDMEGSDRDPQVMIQEFAFSD
jgi:hypothetical protein